MLNLLTYYLGVVGSYHEVVENRGICRLLLRLGQILEGNNFTSKENDA